MVRPELAPEVMGISIHAPREGSDAVLSCTKMSAGYFYPRSPRGERRYGRRFFAVRCVISIHAPREGSDFITYLAT